MIIAAVLIAIAAVFGLTMAILRFRGREIPPLPLAILHGLFAVSGVGVLVFEFFKGRLPDLGIYALGTFVAAALGGLFLFSFHLRKMALPIPYIVGHALVGVTGFGLLIAAILMEVPGISDYTY